MGKKFLFAFLSLTVWITPMRILAIQWLCVHAWRSAVAWAAIWAALGISYIIVGGGGYSRNTSSQNSVLVALNTVARGIGILDLLTRCVTQSQIFLRSHLFKAKQSWNIMTLGGDINDRIRSRASATEGFSKALSWSMETHPLPPFIQFPKWLSLTCKRPLRVFAWGSVLIAW
jgi:hypothetical protein